MSPHIIKKTDSEVISNETIDEVVAEINSQVRLAPLELAMKIGKLLIDKFYSGNFDAWRKKGIKDNSFRKLSEREDLEISPAALYRSVSVYEMFERIGGVSTLKHLKASHYYAVLGLTDKQQKRLLKRAESQTWPVRKIESEAKKVRKKRGKGGRKPIPQFVKSIHQIQKFVNQPQKMFDGINKADELKPEKIKELCVTLEKIQKQCLDMQAQLLEITKEK